MASGSSSSSQSSVGDDGGCGARSLLLTPYFQKNFNINQHVGFRIRVVASDPCKMEVEVFRHYQKPINAVTGEADRVFSGVCSWSDYEDMSKEVPESESSPAAYRLNWFDIVVPTEELAMQVWQYVQDDVADLIRTLNEGDILEAGAAVTVTGDS